MRCLWGRSVEKAFVMICDDVKSWFCLPRHLRMRMLCEVSLLMEGQTSIRILSQKTEKRTYDPFVTTEHETDVIIVNYFRIYYFA